MAMTRPKTRACASAGDWTCARSASRRARPGAERHPRARSGHSVRRRIAEQKRCMGRVGSSVSRSSLGHGSYSRRWRQSAARRAVRGGGGAGRAGVVPRRARLRSDRVDDLVRRSANRRPPSRASLARPPRCTCARRSVLLPCHLRRRPIGMPLRARSRAACFAPARLARKELARKTRFCSPLFQTFGESTCNSSIFI